MPEVNLLGTHTIGALVELVNQDRLVEAEQGARNLLSAHPNVGMLWKILSVVLVRQGKDALPALRKTVALLPDDAEAHRNLGAALMDRGQREQGLESLRCALALVPNDVDTLVDCADTLRALGRAREAVPLYQEALKRNPGAVEARNNLGNAFLELRQFADATECYRQALELRPRDVLISCNLASAARQSGNLDAAMALSERAIALDAHSSAAYNGMGLTLAARGKREEAAANYRRALEINPAYVEALNNLGTVLREMGHRDAALPLHAQAIKLDPRRVESHWSAGTVLFELRRFPEAAACFAQALALRPDYAPAHLSLGFAYRQQRRPEEAEKSCRAALAIDPNSAEALLLLGELRADRGHFDEAEQLFQRAIAIEPDFAPAYFSVATHRRMTGADGAWLAGVDRALAKGPSLAGEISLRYARGKYFDDVGRYEEAFGNYRQANELTKRYGSTYDRAHLTQTVDQITHSCTDAFVQRAAAQGSRSEVPVFIVGVPRSGTSLTEQILASHPSVLGAGEVPFWDAAFSRLRMAGRDGHIDPEAVPGMATEYLARLTRAGTGGLRVVDKMPANFFYAGLIHAAFPRARIIHLRRHPFDTCLSIYFQNFFGMGPYANDLGDLAHYYGEYLRLMNHWRTLLPAAALLEVPYEGLIADQEDWSRRMVEFIGLPWDPKCLEFHQTDRVVITASKWQVRQKIHSASAGRWRHYEKFVGPLREALGEAAGHYRV